jgi:alkanesulfonate monooxygenase SsuD/methylene tetrahydromethanopterin reductase-like flavin-dependent oxidoreductase (luciferase family)
VKFFVLALPFLWDSAQGGTRMAGKRTDLHQRTLEQVVRHAKAADRLGFEGMFFSEQRGNIEGVPEVTPNPIMLDLFVAGHTERLKVGQLGNVLPVANPLHLADQLAYLDQLTQGRALVGFARGNSTRWVNQYGQHFGMKVAKSDKSEDDERNLRATIEAWEIIKLAWTKDTFSYDGEFWKFPVADTKWLWPHTQTWGAGTDPEGNLVEVGIAPGPYQKPYPRIFGPMGGRTATVRFWAGEGATIVAMSPKEDFHRGMLDIYADVAREQGREPRRGEGLLVGGSYSIARTEAEARRLEAEFHAWDSTYYGVPPWNVPHPLSFAGTPDQIVEQIGGLHERLGVDEFMIMDNIGAPHGFEASFEMLEMFGTEVIPQLASL